MIDAPFQRFRAAIGPDWVDYNGHMNVAYYVLAFDRATDLLFDQLGIGAAYLGARHCSLFALEGHIAYERELRLGETISVRTTVLAADRKRLHLFHEMFQAEALWRAASFETMSLHIDMKIRRAAPFPAEIQSALVEAVDRHAALPRPAGIGRRIAMPS
jgi:acyl-CoA thioester hydrolase